MSAMRFDNDGATGGQRGGGIATGHRKRQRKITGAKDRNGADRHVTLPQVRARKRLSIRHGWVDARLDEAAFAYNFGKQTKLRHRPAPLALEACPGQTGLEHGTLDQFVAALENVGRNLLKERGAQRQSGLTA